MTLDDRYSAFRRLMESSGLFTTVRPWDVVCATAGDGKIWLSGNSCKVRFLNDRWFLETWAPVTYRFPANVTIEHVAEACKTHLREARQPGRPYLSSTVNEQLIQRFDLEICEQDEDGSADGNEEAS